MRRIENPTITHNIARLLPYLGCLLLFGCGGGKDDYAGEPIFEGTGRTIEQIMSDIDFHIFSDTLTPYESAAYNLCDCISGTDFEQVQSIVDKVKAMKKDIEDPEERIQQLPEEERRAWDVFASCGFIPTGEFMERRIYDSSRDSVEYYFEKTCPYLKARFMAINNDFE